MADDEADELRNQFLIISRLYTELEEERQASASGVEEALSMILRLQEERAAEKMEALQYKRMAEEKIQHAEESLSILREIMFQKELEITSLKYQLQAYKDKLLSVGVKTLEIGELRIFDKAFLSSGAASDRTMSHRVIRRNISLPPIQWERLSSEIDTINEVGPSTPTGQSLCLQSSDYTKQVGEKYGDNKMQDLVKESIVEPAEINKRMKQSPRSKNVEENDSVLASEEFQLTTSIDRVSAEEGFTSCYSAMRGDSLYDSTLVEKVNGENTSNLPSQAKKLDGTSKCDEHSSSFSEAELDQSAVHAVNLQDIYEVPESHNGSTCSKSCKQVSQEPNLEAKNTIRIPVFMVQEDVDYFLRNDGLLNSVSIYSNQTNKMSIPWNGTSSNYHWTPSEVKSGNDPSHTDVDQLKRQMQQLEGDIRNMKQEDIERGKEELRLLTTIREQLETIQSHVKISGSQNRPQQDETLLVYLMEAMQTFWL